MFFKTKKFFIDELKIVKVVLSIYLKIRVEKIQ